MKIVTDVLNRVDLNLLLFLFSESNEKSMVWCGWGLAGSRFAYAKELLAP